MIRKIVFMGTPDFAVDTLKALIAAEEYEVQAVFTQPDRPKGRGKQLQMSPVKEVAVNSGIPVYQPEKIRGEESWKLLQELQPDVIVVVAFGQLIPQKILDLPPYGCLNVHASLLPSYRGAAPIQWAVLNGEKESGVTIMQMDAGLDTGDILSQARVVLDRMETTGSLFERLSKEGARLLLETLPRLSAGECKPRKQPAESPTAYAGMLLKSMGKIDWQKSSAELDQLVRGMNPWPCAYTMRGQKLLKLWAARAEDSGELFPEQKKEDALPGTITWAKGDRLLVRTGDGYLAILEVQPEGKKRMTTDAYLRGYPVSPGESFR